MVFDHFFSTDERTWQIIKAKTVVLKTELFEYPVINSDRSFSASRFSFGELKFSFASSHDTKLIGDSFLLIGIAPRLYFLKP